MRRKLRSERPPRRDGPKALPRRDTTKGPSAALRGPAQKHQRVAGLPAVEALFRTDPDRIERLFFEAAHKAALQDICLALAESRRVYRIVQAAELEKVAGTPMHGGVVAFARPKPLLHFDAAQAPLWAAEGTMLLVLDGVGNPHNLGAIARTAAFLGLRRLILSSHPGQALPSDASHRVAKGGLEHLEIYRASQLPAALAGLRPHFHVVGTALVKAQPLAQLKRDQRPVALVLGNEEEGLAAATIAACESVVAIVGGGAVQSLNVAVSAAILMHALMQPAGRRV